MNRSALVALGLFAPCLLFGQAPTKALSFDVATIKPNRAGHNAMGGHGICSRGITSITNYSLSTIIQGTYDMKEFQILGRPSWLSSETFDIQAQSESLVSIEQCKLMMQTLLAERFGLQLHRETRQLPVFRLVIARNGPKLRRIADGDPTGVREFITSTKGRLDTRGNTMQQFAQMLAGTRELDNLVIDATGLEGYYEFTLEWTPASLALDGAPGPALTTALQEQLGLKLESGKGSVEVLVIDHVEKTPTAN